MPEPARHADDHLPALAISELMVGGMVRERRGLLWRTRALFPYYLAIAGSILPLALAAPTIPPLFVIALFLVVILSSAWYGGTGPGLLATGIAAATGAVFALHGQITPEMCVIIMSVDLGMVFLGNAVRTVRQRSARAAHQQIASLLDGRTDGVLVLDPAQCVRYANVAAAHLLATWSFGPLHAETLPSLLTGITFFDIRGATVSITQLPHLRALRGEATEEIHLRVAGSQWDEERWWAMKAAPVYDTRGAAMLAVMQVQDITAHKRAETAVAATERRFQAMVEHSTEGIVLFDATRQRTYVSPSTATVLGYTPEEYRTLQRAELFHPDDVDRMHKIFHDLVDKPGTTATVEARVRHKDGMWRWLGISYTNLLDEPDVRAIVANYCDITEHKEAEQALRRQHAYLEALHEMSLGLMHRLDPAEVLHAIIQRAGELLGTEHGFVDLVADDGIWLEFITGHGVFNLADIKPGRRGQGLGGIVWETGQPLLVEDYPTWEHHRPGPHVGRFRSVVAVPLLSGSEVAGVLGLAHTEAGRTFDAAAIETLSRFAQLAAIALQNARLYTQMQESEIRYRLMFENNPLPMWVYDSETLAFFDVNDAAIRYYGYTREEFLAMTIKDIRPPEELPRLLSTLDKDPESLEPGRLVRHWKKDGTRVNIEINSHDLSLNGRPMRLVLANDVTERLRVEEQLRQHALHDALTDLPNRALLLDRLTRALARAKREKGYQFAALYLDFDRFKNINDSLGHLSGDRFLQQVSRRLAAFLRPTDTLARLGGDEFVLLIEEITDVDAAIAIAQQLQASLTDPVVLRKQAFFPSASIGIALGQVHYHYAEEVLRDADIAMYQAKALGRACYVVFDTTMRAQALARLQLEADLRTAIAREELTIAYQPIVALGTGEVTGVEALLRWEHPVHGTVPPAEFIPLAEESGLITTLDRWVLRTACRQMRRWADAGGTTKQLTLSVNISGRELGQPDFVAEILEVLHLHQLAPRQVALEITESSLIEHADVAATALRALHAAGVRVHLDDFGIGYSSLNYLHRFPIAGLKIDRSFISGDITPTIAHTGIVETIVALGERLGITVIAEGIEHAEQRDALTSFGCRYGQGNLFAVPLMSEQMEQMLRENAAVQAERERN